MKRHLIHLAGLTLAATICSLPTMAQQPPRKPELALAGAPGTPPPPAHAGRRTELELSDDGDIAIARAGDAAMTVRKIFAGGEAQDRPLIIASSSPDEKSIATLDEDLNIMARILDKAVDHSSDDDRKGPMGIHLWALGQGGGRGARNLYIEGYGAVFTLNVNMPLLAPLAKPQAEEKKENTSSSWEDARNELYGREERGQFKRAPGDRRASVPYDAERVESLKKDLTEALKNATHIRGLKDNEHVTIVVQGSGSEGGVQRARVVGPKKGELREDVFGYAFAGAGAGGPRSVMTLRAKKGDIDAFAKGKTDLDDFRKKVSTAVYKTPAGGGGGQVDIRGQE